MDLSTLMKNSQIQLKPFWVLSTGVCFVYGLLIGVHSELNAYGELLSLLIAGPLHLGLCMYFLKITKGNTPSFFDLFKGFKPLLNALLLFFIINALTILGLLFLIIPGIIMSLGFSMSYYILSENTEMSFSEALEKSWKLMDGNKMELFILHLRFIPWYILGLLFFVVGIFIVIPWQNLTIANYYQELKNKSKQEGDHTY